MLELKQKTYVQIKRTFIRGKVICKIGERFTINCEGGDSVIKIEELVFVDTNSIKSMSRGKTGRDWSELFAKIPEGKSLIVPKTLGVGATVRSAVNKINKVSKIKYKVTQRADGKTVKVYVNRV